MRSIPSAGLLNIRSPEGELTKEHHSTLAEIMSMKDKFPGYYPPTDEQEKALWDNATFVFDTCSLLNLYSYSEDARLELLAVLNEIKERLWMPYQVASEIHKNRPMRLAAECKNCSDSINLIEKFVKDIDEKHRTKRGHPFITELSMTSLTEATGNVLDELKNDHSMLEAQFRNDPLFEEICNLYGERVGDAVDEKRRSEICKEGRERYKSKIPPGYEDSKDKDEPDMYGDFFLWNEVMEYAQKNKSNIVLVTDDGKEDWWRFDRASGRKKNGPRAELIAEFESRTKQKCWIYDSDSFSFKASVLVHTISPQTLLEVKSIAKLSSLQIVKMDLPSTDISRAIVKMQQDHNALITSIGERFRLLPRDFTKSIYPLTNPYQHLFQDMYTKSPVVEGLMHAAESEDLAEDPMEYEEE